MSLGTFREIYLYLPQALTYFRFVSETPMYHAKPNPPRENYFG